MVKQSLREIRKNAKRQHMRSTSGKDIPGKILLGRYENNILNVTFNGRKEKKKQQICGNLS